MTFHSVTSAHTPPLIWKEDETPASYFDPPATTQTTLISCNAIWQPVGAMVTSPWTPKFQPNTLHDVTPEFLQTVTSGALSGVEFGTWNPWPDEIDADLSMARRLSEQIPIPYRAVFLGAEYSQKPPPLLDTTSSLHHTIPTNNTLPTYSLFPARTHYFETIRADGVGYKAGSNVERDPSSDKNSIEARSDSKDSPTSDTAVQQRGSKRKRGHDSVKANVLEPEQSWHVQNTEVQYCSGKAVGTKQVWSMGKRPARKLGEKEREQIAKNRKLGACPEHRKSKKACDPRWVPYLRCFTSGLPIFLSKLGEMVLFRKRPSANHPLETFRKEVYALQDVNPVALDVLQLSLTQGLGPELTVYVTRFTPKPSDKVQHKWFSDGSVRTMDMPPYCLTRVQKTRENISRYIGIAKAEYIRDIVNRSSDIGKNVLRHAIEFARVRKSKIVARALGLLAMNRMIERDWEVSGQETLGQMRVNNTQNPWHGKVPITPMMDTQLDQIVIQDFLVPRREQLLKDLQAKLDERKREDWFEVLLAVFVLATNMEWLLRHCRANAIRYGAKRRYNSIEQVSAFIHGHNILLSHFHHIYRGYLPLSLDRDDSVPAELQKYLDFALQIKSSLDRCDYILKVREENQYESEFYWSHQIFSANWTPCKCDIVDDIGWKSPP